MDERSQQPAGGARVAFVYDHFFPHTVGGAERYYWRLATAMARERPVAYVTRHVWPGTRRTRRDGVELVGVMRPRRQFAGRRRSVRPTVLFALGVLWHLLREGGRYDVVHCSAFPHLAVLGAWLGLAVHPRTKLVADWHEVWTREYWRSYVGRLGDGGYLVQRLAVRLPDAAATFSDLHRRRLVAQGRRERLFVVPEFPTDPVPNDPHVGSREKLVMFAGRLIPEKRAHLVPAVVRELRRRDGCWRAIVFGRGPDEQRVREAIAAAGVADAVELAGFAPWEKVSAAMLRASALLLPATREGFGLVVLEAAGHGLPAVLVAGPDNAATELVEEGENGIVCRTPEPAALADAVQRLADDPGIHERAHAWFTRASAHYSVDRAAREAAALHEQLIVGATEGSAR